MLLRRLEAYGFKSFAEKTEIEFKQGITAIVGPNGSGKSNISDAVRWVLGEQNIRNLRGTKMEDVIFSGSAKRRALGVAEVSLIFDNSDGLLPLEFNEVTITRRVFRSGDGEYYINKSPCRLKDIHDLLIEAGLGRESMTVISQNKIDEVLNSKPDERRLIFEEAAGIMKYKNRKKEALRKLEDTEQNLTRIRDITAEIETQLDPLAESARRTARYNELAAEQTSCQVTLLLHKLTQAEKNLDSITLERTVLADEEATLGARLSVAETDKERMLDGLTGLDASVREAEAAITRTATDLERLDGRNAVLAERIEQERRGRERLEQELARLDAESGENRSKLGLWQQNLKVKKEEAAALEASLTARAAELQTITVAVSAVENKINQAKDATFGHLQELVTQKNSLRTLERDQSAQTLQESRLAKEREGYATELQAARTALDSLLREKRELEQNLTAIDAEIAGLRADRQELEKRAAETRRQENSLTVTLNGQTSRLKLLGDMQDEYEGFGRGAKSVLKSDAPWRQGIYGAIAEIIGVRDEHVVAVETALGGAMQNIIVESDAVAKAAVEFLKSRSLGRATFLPLNTIRQVKQRDAEIAAAHAQGAVGFACDLVECAERYRPAIDFLLARTVVAADMDAALKIARQCGFAVKIVTLDGQLINPGGSITGGSVGRRETSFLGRASEIAALKQNLTETRDKLAAVRQELEHSQARAAAVDTELQAAAGRRQSREVRLAEAGVHTDKTTQDVRRLELALATLDSELAACRREYEELAAKLAGAASSVTELESRDAEHKLKLASWQEELSELAKTKEAKAAALTDAKIKLSALEQEVHSIAANCENYEQAIARLARQLETARGERERTDAEIGRAQDELAALAAQKEALLGRRAEEEKSRDTLLAQKLDILARQQKLERETKDLRRRQTIIQSRLHEIELAAARYNYDVTYCSDQLRNNYSLDRDAARAMFREEAPELLAARLKELEADIYALGPVNPAAIDEYTRLKDRYEFLQTQCRDLTEAKEYLMSIIKDIDNTMSRQFKTAFVQINEHFGELFVRLFGGGKAHLELADPDNILASGIEIIVQPPGKKQQNLALLSGGERALTVIALLFAFLTFRPTPFCVLDEIDAALDEANVQRFSEFLADYSRNTQFIIVTHRKGTMEVADVMHGVTMEESGISKLISVKFMDKAG